MVSLTLFLVAVSGLVFSKNFLDDYFSPPAVYSFFWCVALGFLTLDWVSYDPLGSQVWMVITISYLAFMSGAAIIALYGFTRNHWLSAEPELATIDRARFERALKFLFCLGIAGFIFQLAHLQASVGLQTFLSSPDLAREMHSNIKYLGFFNVLNVANFVLALMYLVLYRRPGKWVLLILIWALLTTFLTTDRTRFFYMVIWSFYVAVYLVRRVNLSPRVILSACVTMLVLLGFFLLVAKVYKKQAFDDNMEFVNIDQRYQILVDPYIYLTGSFPVLQAYLEDKQEPTYGKHTLAPAVKLIELFYPLFQREDIVGKFYRVPIELNACTYLQPFYHDFGFVGILVGPFLMGLFSMWAYLAMRQRKTLFTVYLSSLLSFCVTISIFVNHFSQITTWYFIAVGYCVYRYTLTHRVQPDNTLHKFIYS